MPGSLSLEALDVYIYPFLWVRLIPQRVRTAARFLAVDPWRGGSPVEHSVEECVFLPKGTAVSSPRARRLLGGGTVYFLRSEADGTERLLPEALVELWRTGKVPAEWLPQLLQERPGKVRRPDALPILHRKLGPWIAGALVAALVGGGAFTLGRSAYRGKVTAGMPVSMPAEAWLAAPAADGQRLRLQSFLPVAGSDHELFSPTVPREVRKPLDRQAQLAWTKAAEGFRLVMVGRSAYWPSDSEVEVGSGVVMETQKVGVPPATLARLRQRVPNLDTRLVLCADWMIDPNALGVSGALGAAGFLLGLVGVAVALGSLLALPLLAVRQAGRRREMAAILARLGVAHG